MRCPMMSDDDHKDEKELDPDALEELSADEGEVEGIDEEISE